MCIISFRVHGLRTVIVDSFGKHLLQISVYGGRLTRSGSRAARRGRSAGRILIAHELLQRSEHCGVIVTVIGKDQS